MKSLLDGMTTFSANKPKTAVVIFFVFILTLSPFAMFIQFDNSEDAFFPDNETVQLLNEVEDEYQASIDFIRFIDRIESGDLYESETWEKLAILEAILLENSDLDEYQYPLYGIQPNNGMASTAIQWFRIQDKESNLPWINNLSTAINAVTNSTNETRNSSLVELGSLIETIPSPSVITSQELRDWTPKEPDLWLKRIDDNSNISSKIISLNLEIEVMVSSLGNDPGLGAIHAGQISAKLGVLQGMQNIDYKALLISNLPAEDKENPWQSDGPILTSFVVITDPEIHDKEVIGDVQEEISVWATQLLEQAKQETGDDDVSVFSFSQLATGQNANLGKELGILNSVCLLLLGFILWTKFRSIRDTASVLTLTVFAIIATYGSAGLLTMLGLKMPFNAAMNSIPILLLAIGVDYGLHVVSRIREELLDEEKNNPQNRETLKDFSIDARREAIRKGTLLTSAALMVAIFTDIVGFLSFRFSTQAFLVSFGTVIAIGLFYIYILSITVLPALMMLIPPKKLKLEKSGKIEIGPVSKWIGSLTKTPVKVVAVTIIISIPMFVGFQQLEVGFDTRDNFDDSVPVVQDFLVIADEFQSSPAPLYVVINGDVISFDGRKLYNEVISQLDTTEGVNGVPVGIWSVLEESRISYPELDSLMTEIESDESAYGSLKDWLLSSDGRNISSGNLNSDASQTVISFQAATLDWQDAVDFEVSLSEKLADVTEDHQGNFDAKLSGRSLILAQVTADVADSAVISTATVAGVILLMLISINSFRQKDVIQGAARGFVTWIPLMAVVVWVYGIMGLTGYQLNSQTVTIGALTLGLGVDYAVHLTTRLEEEVEHNPHGTPEDWVTKSSATTGRAMFGAALTTAGGFSVLNLSSLVPLQLFGQVFVVAIILALVSSLMLLPPLYASFLRKDAEKYLASMPLESE